ncbi:hypothetical protein ACJZ2D_014823 [Fusarium nematophilum]
MKVAWERLIRFVATDGRVLRGEPILPSPDFDLGDTTESTQLLARVIQADNLYDNDGRTKVTDEVVMVKRLLGPLTSSDVPIAQDSQADYEGELCVIIGKDAKDVTEEEALDYVAAYTVGNDISSRRLQRDPALAGPVPQWGFSKGFDTFAPLGPVLVSSCLIPDPSLVHLTTIVDGEVRQSSGVNDLLFSIPYLIAFLSTGTTLQKGSIIMTGTPGGVGSGLKPPRYLVPGTKMEVHVTQIGTLRNGVEFAGSGTLEF